MSRRGAQEGTIRQRKDGRWEGRVFLGYREGRRLRPSVYGDTRSEVNKKLTAVIAQHSEGNQAASGRQTVGQYLDAWLQDYAKPKLKPRTFDGYRDHVVRHIKPELGRIPLSKLGGQEIQRWVNRKAASGLSPSTVRYMFAVLRAALKKAEKLGLIQRSPAFTVDLPKRTRHSGTYLSPEQARAFLAKAADHRLGPLFTVALAVGLRIGEAFALRWADLELEVGVLKVRHTLYRVKGQVVFGEPKSVTSRRTVRLPKFAVEALGRLRTAQKAERLRAGSEWQDFDLVFTTPIGTALDHSNCRREFHGILKAAGLPLMRVHDLRHTCASLLLVKGVSMKVVQEILGHSQISITADTYSHVSEALKQGAAQEMEDLMKVAQ